MHLFAWMMTAQAADLPELEQLAIATGDVDCSGTLDVAVLYTDKEGNLIVEIAQGVPEKELPEPISPLEGATIHFYDSDEDKCEDLFVTPEKEEHYLLKGAEHKDIMEMGLKGEGDSVPDSYIALRKPVKHPTGWLYWGLGDFEFCDWDHYCYPNECAETCSSWGYTEPKPCGTDDYGNPLLCYTWGCTSWKQYCIQPPW